MSDVSKDSSVPFLKVTQSKQPKCLAAQLPSRVSTNRGLKHPNLLTLCQANSDSCVGIRKEIRIDGSTKRNATFISGTSYAIRSGAVCWRPVYCGAGEGRTEEALPGNSNGV